MHIIHLTASPFFGGPERQMLGLARSLPAPYRTTFLSFPERGLCRPFLDEARQQGCAAEPLAHNTPYIAAAARELTGRLRALRADVLCCHGYKADVVGLLAGRRCGLPVVAVSRGWTAATWRVRLYEWLDRRSLRHMDAVVCVSDGQAAKVRRAGVEDERIHVIRNAVHVERFNTATADRAFLQAFFPQPRTLLIGAAGRLSPEKGFDVLVEAAPLIVRSCPGAGFVLFGDGPLRARLAARIAELKLQDHFVLAGFRDDLDRWLASFDVTVLPSYTEGLPNVVLESLAARVPVVATAVGGTPEVVEDGASGYLVPPGEAAPLAARVVELLGSATLRRRMGQHGQRRMRAQFTFAAQARHYQRLFADLVPSAGLPLPVHAKPAGESASLRALRRTSPRRLADSPAGLAATSPTQPGTGGMVNPMK